MPASSSSTLALCTWQLSRLCTSTSCTRHPTKCSPRGRLRWTRQVYILRSGKFSIRWFPYIQDLSGRTLCISRIPACPRTGRTEHSPPCTHFRRCLRSNRASDSILRCPHFRSARTWSPPCIQLEEPRTWPQGTGPCSGPPLHHSAIHRPTHHKGASDSPLHPWLSPLWTHVRKSTLPEAWRKTAWGTLGGPRQAYIVRFDKFSIR